MKTDTPSIRLHVDAANPGHFFSCCALLELADRAAGSAKGCFSENTFHIAANIDLGSLLKRIVEAPLLSADQDDEMAPPMTLGVPFNIRIDWWKSPERGSAGLKLWAGSMRGHRIAQAMQKAISHRPSEYCLDFATVVRDPDNPKKKVEPFYFDARRGPNAHSRDVGFSPNDLSYTTAAFPAVEFLALVGLQRARPIALKKARHYRYHTWSSPIPPTLLPIAIAGGIAPISAYEFESWFRTGQKKHKAFLSAQPSKICSSL